MKKIPSVFLALICVSILVASSAIAETKTPVTENTEQQEQPAPRQEKLTKIKTKKMMKKKQLVKPGTEKAESPDDGEGEPQVREASEAAKQVEKSEVH